MKKLMHVKMIVCCTMGMMHQNSFLIYVVKIVTKVKRKKWERNTTQDLKVFSSYSPSTKIVHVRTYGKLYDMAQD